MPARELFVHLILIADDFGLLSVAPLFLRRHCFNDPKITDEHVNELLGHLTTQDLLRIFEHDGARYGFIPRFGQRLRLRKPKHPRPPTEVLKGDSDAENIFKEFNNLFKNPSDARQTHDSNLLSDDSLKLKEKEKEKLIPKGIESGRGTRFSLEKIPDEWRLFCTTHCPRLDPEQVFAEFRDFWTDVPGKGGFKLNWEGTWRNNVRRKASFEPPVKAGQVNGHWRPPANWWKSDELTEQVAKHLKLPAARGEDFYQWRQRLRAELEKRETH